MSYYVNLGGIYITGVKDVSLTSSRDMTDYDGLGNGKFSVPESENLKEWTITCELATSNIYKYSNWQAAGYIFTALETLLKTKDYSRFISVSSSGNISQLVRLKQYTSKEKREGVYDVEITVQEYKAVAVKTTGVPYITRPGKIPIPAKVTITSKNTVYKTTKKLNSASKTVAGPKKYYGLVNSLNGKQVTNSAVAKGQPYTISTVGNLPYTSVKIDPDAKLVTAESQGMTSNWYDGTVTSISSTFNWISKGIGNWIASW